MPTEPGDVVLKVDDLTKHYAIEKGAIFFAGETKTVKANEKLNFNAREAETVAIVGESGCGKSTFAKVLMGLETATDGNVVLGNLELGNTAGRQARRGHDLQPADDLPESRSTRSIRATPSARRSPASSENSASRRTRTRCRRSS